MDEKKAILEGLLFVVGEDGLTLEQIEDFFESLNEKSRSYDRKAIWQRRTYSRRDACQ